VFNLDLASVLTLRCSGIEGTAAAAAILGAADRRSAKAGCRGHFISATEYISGRAMHPATFQSFLVGKTIVSNTDAEGRLTPGGFLWCLRKNCGCDRYYSWPGACVIALGDDTLLVSRSTDDTATPRRLKR